MNDEKERNQKQELAKAAAEYIAGKVAGGKQQGAGYPLNRGDTIMLVMPLERELRSASSDFTDPFNRKRLTAIRDKLGALAIDTPQMSKAEAQQFRE